MVREIFHKLAAKASFEFCAHRPRQIGGSNGTWKALLLTAGIDKSNLNSADGQML
jgi:hypothetical protein